MWIVNGLLDGIESGGIDTQDGPTLLGMEFPFVISLKAEIRYKVSTMRTKGILVVLIAFLAISADRIQAQSPVDSDRDGISDELEQNLLMKFRPSFLVSSDDCDRVPAEFTPFIATPTVEKKNGTIYGQVRRGSSDIQRNGVFLEVHYYHLWAHDCGQMGHPLDAEHVSALVHAPEMDSPISEWTAQYWYAAAHQDTICDSSTMTMATTLSATASGPTVWISDGKHASFFSAEDCRKGCGGDRCDLMVPIPYERLVNVGELDAPMNGGTWTAFNGWILHEKFGNDFNGPTLDVIDSQPAGLVLSVSESPSGVKAIILGGNAGITGLAIGDQHTSNALGVAARKTWKALKISGGAVKRSLGGGSPQ